MNAARTASEIDREIAALKSNKLGLDAWSHKDAAKMDEINDQIADLERERRAVIRCNSRLGW